MKIRTKAGAVIDLDAYRNTLSPNAAKHHAVLEALEAVLCKPEAAPTIAQNAKQYVEGYNDFRREMREAAGVVEEPA